MVVVGLLLEVLGMLNGLLSHFVGTPAVTYTQGADGEWTLSGLTPPALTEKGNSLMGAVADILVYGATLVDWLTQALVGTSVAGSP
jgi:hypothetical protein